MWNVLVLQVLAKEKGILQDPCGLATLGDPFHPFSPRLPLGVDVHDGREKGRTSHSLCQMLEVGALGEVISWKCNVTV